MKDMPDILQRICRRKEEEIRSLHEKGAEPLRRRLAEQSAPRGFRPALVERPEVALIAEVKKASPSAGLIREGFDPRSIASAYQEGGARCLSVLTDRDFFQGSLEYLQQAREAVNLPVLRKDFVLDDMQVLEARAWGADCILLIVAALEKDKLRGLRQAALGQGMDVLVEAHTREELETALEIGADLVGINNRDLRTFEVRLETSCELAGSVPDGVTLVAESGIRSREDVMRLKEHGIDAILVGESLMRSDDLVSATRELSDI